MNRTLFVYDGHEKGDSSRCEELSPCLYHMHTDKAEQVQKLINAGRIYFLAGETIRENRFFAVTYALPE